jgi:hypothetical protein
MGDPWTQHLQDDELARPAGSDDGEEGEAYDEAGKSPEVAGTEDQQTVPSTHYVSPVSLCCRRKSSQDGSVGEVSMIETRQGGRGWGRPETQPCRAGTCPAS